MPLTLIRSALACDVKRRAPLKRNAAVKGKSRRRGGRQEQPLHRGDMRGCRRAQVIDRQHVEVRQLFLAVAVQGADAARVSPHLLGLPLGLCLAGFV